MTEVQKDEQLLVLMGQERYIAKLAGLAKANKTSISSFGSSIINAAIGPVEKAVVANMQFVRAEPLLAPDLLAYIGLSVVLNHLEPDMKFGVLARKVGKAVQTEWQATQLNLPSTMTHTQLTTALRKHQPETLTQHELLRIGTTVLAAIEAKTRLIKFGMYNHGTRRFRIVSPSEDMLRYYDTFIRDNEFTEPVKRPIESFPIPYDADLIGGYAFDVLAKIPALKCREDSQMENLKEFGDTNRIRKVLNDTQSVPYELDKQVFDVAWELHTTNKVVAGLPPQRETLPKVDNDADKETLNTHLRRYHKAKVRNNSIIGQRFNSARTLMVAKSLVDSDRFYFPVYVDFRGRIYYHGDYLQPQGTDLAKSLLQFKNKAKIDNDWFYFVHGATTYGLGKKSYSERYNWVKRNHNTLLAIAQKPMKYLDRWEGADDPFAFLAFCFDYAKYTADPENYESGLRICADASSSGLQILSLLLRDQQGCVRTNVLPGEQDVPSDVYMECAGILKGLLQIDADSGLQPACDNARYWLDFLKDDNCRSLVKRPLMTTVYSLSPYGLRKYVRGWIDDKRGDLEEDLFEYDKYLVKQVQNSIAQTVHGASVCMDFIKNVSKALSEDDRSLNLLMPNGFYMTSVYHKTKVHRVRTRTQGNLFHVNWASVGPKLDATKANNASVPNVIHALDAAILYDFVENVPPALNFSLVHDCVFFRAADVDTFYEQIRESFVTIFSKDWLTDFREQVETYTDVELPTVPPMGEIDFVDIHESPYLYH